MMGEEWLRLAREHMKKMQLRRAREQMKKMQEASGAARRQTATMGRSEAMALVVQHMGADARFIKGGKEMALSDALESIPLEELRGIAADVSTFSGAEPDLPAVSQHGPCLHQGRPVRDALPPLAPHLAEWVQDRLDHGEAKYGTVLTVGWDKAVEAMREEVADAMCYAVAAGLTVDAENFAFILTSLDDTAVEWRHGRWRKR